MNEVVSITFELPYEKSRELELLMARAGLKSRKDLINTALSLFDWVVKEQEGGKTIASLDQANKHYKELRIPGLSVTELPAERSTESAYGFPRRQCLYLMTPAELAVHNALQAVEEVGADPLLTAAVNLLHEAGDKVADYVDQSMTRDFTQQANS